MISSDFHRFPQWICEFSRLENHQHVSICSGQVGILWHGKCPLFLELFSPSTSFFANQNKDHLWILGVYDFLIWI